MADWWTESATRGYRVVDCSGFSDTSRSALARKDPQEVFHKFFGEQLDNSQGVRLRLPDKQLRLKVAEEIANISDANWLTQYAIVAGSVFIVIGLDQKTNQWVHRIKIIDFAHSYHIDQTNQWANGQFEKYSRNFSDGLRCLKDDIRPTSHKLISTFNVKGEQGTASANLTAIGTIKKKDGSEKKWVRKILSSSQEVLIECITGEVYRYLIGEKQPKIRTGEERSGLVSNTILSEFVRYRSVRDLYTRARDEDINPHLKKDRIIKKTNYRINFINNIDGFMRVLFSSIFMEENDLSDMNYGLSITYIDENTNSETYGEFIKIDHGQSLNSMRIKQSSKPLSRAELKFFPPVTCENDRPLDDRNKDDRKSSFTVLQGRRYAITPSFVEYAVFDFLLGFIDKDYILNLSFQPSILPLYDGRLLSFFDQKDVVWQGRMYDKCEEAKFKAIAKIIFTSDELYLAIARAATEQRALPEKQESIRRKIIEKKLELVNASSSDPDFFAFCFQNMDEIKQEIHSSQKRISENLEGGNSKRYGGLKQFASIDEELLLKFTKIGEAYADQTIRENVKKMLDSTIDKIASTNWDVGFGGIRANIRSTGSTVSTKVPDNVYRIIQSIGEYQLAPTTRLLKAYRNTQYHTRQAISSTSLFRKSGTTDFYNTLNATLISTAESRDKNKKDALTIFNTSYQNKNQGIYFNLMDKLRIT